MEVRSTFASLMEYSYEDFSSHFDLIWTLNVPALCRHPGFSALKLTSGGMLSAPHHSDRTQIAPLIPAGCCTATMHSTSISKYPGCGL